MSEIAPPHATTSAPRKPQARRWWALAVVVILALIPLHWLLFQGQEVVPGVIARPLGPGDEEWFEHHDCLLGRPKVYRLSQISGLNLIRLHLRVEREVR